MESFDEGLQMLDLTIVFVYVLERLQSHVVDSISHMLVMVKSIANTNLLSPVNVIHYFDDDEYCDDETWVNRLCVELNFLTFPIQEVQMLLLLLSMQSSLMNGFYWKLDELF